MAEMTAEARAARNAYRRAWYRANKEKARSYITAYWERKAAAAADLQEHKDESEGNENEEY